jgi:hypothetical protein
MEDPVRFSEGDDDAAKRLMLSMRDEKPPEGAATRALLALGVTGAAVVTTGSALGAASPAGKSLAWLAAKWLGTGAVVGLAVGGGATLLSTPGAPRQESPPAITAPIEREAPASAPAPRPAPAAAEPEPEEEKPAPRASNAKSVATDPVETLVAADTLPREIELLDEARAALRSGAPQRALSSLDRYAKEFPRGRLSTEALVVRIDALVRSGQTVAARSLGERFLASYPNSPHAPRIKQLIGR